MTSNFDFLKADPQFDSFADTALHAEMALAIAPSLCASACRTSMESAVKWLYSVDESLVMPYDDRLSTLLFTDDFRDLLPNDLFPKLDFIRRAGNNATHSPKAVSYDQAVLALEFLHGFLQFIAYCYSANYQETSFDASLLNKTLGTALPSIQEQDLNTLAQKNKPLRASFTIRRKKAQATGAYSGKPIDFTESRTRSAYIDVMLIDAGWRRNVNWLEEYRLEGIPSASGKGAADYVLMGDDGIPLAVVEAKKTSVSVEKGRQQAVVYADALQRRFGRRPLIFITNGYETRLWDDTQYPNERSVSGIYAKRDLEKLFNIRKERCSLKHIQINDTITNRYYQKEAVQNVCEAFDARNRRKALLVMATGSGKTRTVISLVDVLIRHGWIKNVLFLADRNALVTQAKRAFHNMLPNLSLCNLTEGKEEASARVVLSTYQTMINCIDSTRDQEGGKLFTPGHFDLIVVDEAHRSIYNKYRDIFTYFDALLVGLTATPKADVGKSTYAIFDLQNGVPTYGYELAQAVQDGYLVDYQSIETNLKFMTEGIHYDDLTEKEKQIYEATFATEDGLIPQVIDPSALNEWIFNYDTIKKALHQLMSDGLKVNFGNRVGKTIVFAKNHKHAEKIFEVWGKEFAEYPPHFCEVIDNYATYAQQLIDDFSEVQKLPQIAISVDMLDTGIDVPSILNLVMFKRVLSKAKFWQMIGRGTRLCGGLIDGKDKQAFYVFDLCGNFEFFRINPHGKEATASVSLQSRLFKAKVETIYFLQKDSWQEEEYQAFRRQVIDDVHSQVSLLDRENFAVRQHLRIVDAFSDVNAFASLSFAQVQSLGEEVSPLISPEQDDFSALRFDMLIYQIILAIASEKPYEKARRDLIAKANQLTSLTAIPEVSTQKQLIDAIGHGQYTENLGISGYDHIRIALRDLMKYIPANMRNAYHTDFEDDILDVKWNDSQLENDDLVNYKKKVSFYLKQNMNLPAISKLRNNIPLLPQDIRELERILWSELGTQEQYTKEYGNTPLGELVRSIVGLDQKAANEAFSAFMNQHRLDARQMHFVKLIIDYIIKNGMMKDLRVLQSSPFSDQGSIVEMFEDTKLFLALRSVIDAINRNAAA